MAEWRKMDEDEVKYYREFQKKLKDVIDGINSGKIPKGVINKSTIKSAVRRMAPLEIDNLLNEYIKKDTIELPAFPTINIVDSGGG